MSDAPTISNLAIHRRNITGPIFQKPLSKEMCSSRGAAIKTERHSLQSLSQLEFGSALYGGYWTNHDVFRPYSRGMASLADMRRLHAKFQSVCAWYDAQTEMGTS